MKNFEVAQNGIKPLFIFFYTLKMKKKLCGRGKGNGVQGNALKTSRKEEKFCNLDFWSKLKN